MAADFFIPLRFQQRRPPVEAGTEGSIDPAGGASAQTLTGNWRPVTILRQSRRLCLSSRPKRLGISVGIGFGIAIAIDIEADCNPDTDPNRQLALLPEQSNFGCLPGRAGGSPN
jgi:hypothetical protein